MLIRKDMKIGQHIVRYLRETCSGVLYWGWYVALYIYSRKQWGWYVAVYDIWYLILFIV